MLEYHFQVGNVRFQILNKLTEFHYFLGNQNVVEMLIKNGADLDLVDDEGNSVLFTAIEGGNVQNQQCRTIYIKRTCN